MRHFLIATAVLGVVATTTSVFAAVVPTRVPAPVISSSIAGCEDDLGFLTVVRKNDVMSVSRENQVVVYPVCQEDHLSGNASGLRGLIGENAAMSAALAAEDMRAEDVVGIRFGADGMVMLYVMR